MTILYFNRYFGDLNLKIHCFHSDLHTKGVEQSQLFSREMSGKSASITVGYSCAYGITTSRDTRDITVLYIVLLS
jgi:hypothetical protein